MNRAGRGLPAIVSGLAFVLGCERAAVTPPSAELTIEAVAGGTPQSAAVGTIVPVAPSVRVLDPRRRPLVGARVVFRPLRNRGVVTGGEVETDANGIATVGGWTMGTVSGPHELSVFSSASTSAAEFIFMANALPGSPAALAITPATISLAPGATRTLAAAVVDQYGNVVTSGVSASFLSASPTTASVSMAGVVSGGAVGVTNISATFGAFARTVWTAVGSRPTGASVSEAYLGQRAYGLAISSADVLLAGAVTFARRFDLPGEVSTTSITGMSNVHGIAFSPSGATAYVASFSADQLHIVDIATNTILRSVAGMSNPTRVLVSPDGAFVYVTTYSGDLLRVRTANDSVASLALGGRLNGMAFNGTRPALYVTNVEGTVFDVDLTSFTPRLSRSISGIAQGVAVSLDGTRLFVANEGGGMQVLDATTLVRRVTVAAAAGGHGVALTRDATAVYVTQPALGQVTVIDADTYAVVRTIPATFPGAIAFNASGTIGVFIDVGTGFASISSIKLVR